MKNNTSNTSWFTLLVTIGVIGFLLVLLTGVFRVVLYELRDTRNMDNFIKSKSAAEAWEEIALLKLKEREKTQLWFGYQDEAIFEESEAGIQGMLTDLNANYNPAKDVQLQYKIDSAASSYSGTLQVGESHIIPMFTTNESSYNINKTSQPKLRIMKNGSIIGWDESKKVVWNLLGTQSGTGVAWLSWVWQFDSSSKFDAKKTIEEVDGDERKIIFKIESDKSIQELIDESEYSYLAILNAWSEEMGYQIDSNWWDFTKPFTKIVASGKVWNVKQNLEIEIDQSKYFDVLKYALYDFAEQNASN